MLRVRKPAKERREAREDALRHALGDRLAVHPGGMALWLEGIGVLQDPASFSAWVSGCQTRGLRLRSGHFYDLEKKALAGTRLGFTAFTPEELQRAVALMS